MGSVLQRPAVYILFQKIMGANKSRLRYITEYVHPLPGERILDVGCGPGYLADYFRGAEYVGLDTDAEYINYAKRKYGNQGSFFCQELDEAAVRRFGYFDKVIMSGLLHHLNDGEVLALFERAKRVLKAGGCVVTLDGCYVDRQPFIARKLLDCDRGKHVRARKDYEALARTVFSSAVSHIRHDLSLIPYTFIIMKMS